MPIRHVGILAKRASTWPRDHFCRSMIAPRSLWPTKRVLADIDADHGDCALQLLGHGVLLVFGAPSQHPIAGGAGARPDHPITGHCAPQGGNCGILRQTRWDGSMKRRTLKWHLLLVRSVLVSCDCTRI